MANDMVFLGVAPVASAERMATLLRLREVKIELVHNSKTCSSGGCAVTMEMWADAKDIQEIQQFFASERARDIQGLDFDPELMNQVYDPEQERATCPACGTQFSTTLAECPDCGLCFG